MNPLSSIQPRFFEQPQFDLMIEKKASLDSFFQVDCFLQSFQQGDANLRT
jgi:hypothetical protein